ncbi:MAG: hypothetical protein Q4F00_11025 [bacterium]|nr:hypothetical protein [bacterium]
MSAKILPSVNRHLSWLTGVLEPQEAYWFYSLAFLGLLIRLLASWLQPAFVDEAAVYYATKAGWDALTELFKFENHPPTYNILMYPLISLSDSIFVLRLPAVGLYLLTLGAAYQICRRCFAIPAALSLAAFGALSYSVWLTEAQLRSYGPLMCLITWFWLGIADICEHKPPYQRMFPDCPSRGWMLLALTVLGADSLHLLGIMITGSCLAVMWRIKGRESRLALICVIGGALPVIVWYAWMQLHRHDFNALSWQGISWQTLLAIPLSVLNFSTSDSILHCWRYSQELARYSSAVSLGWLAGNAALWAMIGWGWRMLRRRMQLWADMLALSAILPIAALAVSGSLGLPGLQTRYAAVTWLPLTIMLAEIWRNARWGKIAAGLLLGWSALLAIAFPLAPILWNQYWQSSLDYIEANRRQGDLIFVYVPYAGFSFVWAYDGEHAYFEFGEHFYRVKQTLTDGKLPVFLLSQNLDYQPSREELANLAHKRVFLILNQADRTGPPRWLFERYRMAGHFGHRSLKYWADTEVILLEWKQ